MKKLLSLPPNAVGDFNRTNGLSDDEYFCASDPVGHKLGSGGGTVWILDAQPDGWVGNGERRIVLHAGGQSRRLPAYAAGGKLSIPVPVFRWMRGQKIDQVLMDLQMPLFERIMQNAPAGLTTMVVSGDVLIRTSQPLQAVPDVDVVCYGLWVSPSLAKNHGVFFMNRKSAEVLDFVLQKPSTERLAELAQTHLAMMDIGIWLFSDRAMEVLRKRCFSSAHPSGEQRVAYDLYSEFGCAMGCNPTTIDDEINQLKVAVLPLEGGEFYHFGTTPEMISSTLALQNKVLDQRLIIQKEVKKHPAVFTQNAIIDTAFTEYNQDIWVENSHLPSTWTIESEHAITGVPMNDWHIHLRKGQCVDIEPIGDAEYVVRPYGYRDAMRGDITDCKTLFLGVPFAIWAEHHGVDMTAINGSHDLQAAEIFPVCRDMDTMGKMLEWMLSDVPSEDMSGEWMKAERLSADDIAARANLLRQHEQRRAFLKENIPGMEANYRKSVFYQVDLKDLAAKHVDMGIDLPAPLTDEATAMQHIHDAMFRARVMKLRGENEAAKGQEIKAFALLSEQIVDTAVRHPQHPRLAAHSDQIVWGRSAVRIDIAGGWTDTPPHCLLHGGNVVNMAIELNGQQPLQVYVKPSQELCITCRSIDLGAMERIETYDELAMFSKVGSPFSIPKAALALCGFLPRFCAERYPSLREQLRAFGSGIEITLLSAIPAGSGLGTSSILAATVLGALADFCGLAWDKGEIGNRSLILEQLLTTGGGWQDQYGGILPGIKLLQTEHGFGQIPVVRWMPDMFFRYADYQQCHLLYYTGVTRTAKSILAEIVQGMFLNSSEHLDTLQQMKQQAAAMFDAVQLGDFERYGRLVRKTWQQNKALDAGTEPPVIAELCSRVDDLCLGYKLPGAGGGGYLYMVAKDAEAASRIRSILTDKPCTPSARFVDMTLSDKGLRISRS